METKVEKLVIIGSGPAGLTAAVYAARGNLSPLVVAGRQAGGQLMLTTDVDDFPGFEDGIQGPELMLKMRKQAERFGTKFIDEDALNVGLQNRPFTIATESKEIKTKALIVATGASAMWLGLPSEERLIGKGVSACAVCDGMFFKDKEVIVVGGGDAAMREAQHLSKLCKKVTIVHRRDQLRAQPALQDLVRSKPNVDFIWDSVIEEFIGEEKLQAVRIKNVKTGEITEKRIDGVFVAIGHKPNTDFLNGQLEVDEKGYIVVKNETRTSVEGVFWAGDVADRVYKQAVTAAGAGCKAALDVEHFLETIPATALTTA
ncbi:MAG: Thioredoxin reductase [Candidatus Daviesbacteria bacterium GW2011_GWA2_38_24]|uniref:Thioredoxin reductase n=1 Tax=Candidatus Daviesbacteria bacterium GW2011_GWA2_38_24 TaxID=1618422 RepID=A0A0G0JRE1_9BACT|nr:MAG: Thioredoxin reductase [Candidatus Daviesbacteria bacterium GW2011_GWA2_38_24]